MNFSEFCMYTFAEDHNVYQTYKGAIQMSLKMSFVYIHMTYIDIIETNIFLKVMGIHLYTYVEKT